MGGDNCPWNWEPIIDHGREGYSGVRTKTPLRATVKINFRELLYPVHVLLHPVHELLRERHFYSSLYIELSPRLIFDDLSTLWRGGPYQ